MATYNDYNLSYDPAFKSLSNVIISDTAAILQGVESLLFFNKDDIYYGNGNEPDLQPEIFELISDVGDKITLDYLKTAIETNDRRCIVDLSRSSVTPDIANSAFDIVLSLIINNTRTQLSRTVTA